jgi:threonine aldolase
MSNPKIDLRSDTVTKPTAAMRQFMADAEVGDDVIDIDPSVDELQREIANRLGKEAAIFVPSGSMSNQLAVRVHCQPGDELLCEVDSHLFNYEQGAFAQLSGIVARTVEGERGEPRLEQLTPLIHSDNEHLTRTRLVCLENTHNRGGGLVLNLERTTEICRWAHEHGLKTHLDGARLFNAVVASGISASTWADPFDTVSVCFSKGLGAPVGSALVGSRESIQLARRHRKLFGGGMRQAGIIAAGALFALRNHVDRLAEDHANAQLLADAIAEIDGISLPHDPIETNIVYFDVDPRLGTATDFMSELAAANVLSFNETPTRIRLLTHLDVSTDEVAMACQVIREVAQKLRTSAASSTTK